MIRFNQLCFSYTEEKQVLKNVNLHITAGEFVAILGANGSGKSTLAQHINALLLPQSGTVSVCEMPTNDPQNTYAIRSLVGMVFQNPDDQIVASLVENDVAFGPKNVGLSPAEQRERVAEALRAVGLEGFERRETATLSGGQKQRLAIAGALALHPRILVLDEATSMLDPQGKAELMRVITKLHQAGLTIVMITHSMEEAAHAQRIIVLHEGEVLADAPSKQLLGDTALLEAAGLELSFASQLTTHLQQLGVPVPLCTTIGECKETLCRLF